MPKLYKVNDSPDLFIDKQCRAGKLSGYISYRMVLCHAIFHDLKTLNLPKDKIKENLEKLSSRLELNPFEDTDFFESYPILNTSHGRMIVVIDKTNGCYPLILHNDSTLPNEFRISAFKESINDITVHIEKIFMAIDNAKEFDESLHDSLENYFHFSNS